MSALTVILGADISSLTRAMAGATVFCDEPGFLAAQVFAVAAETGWPEEPIIFMSLARLAQYQHCLFRRNGVRTNWSSAGEGDLTLRDRSEALRMQWKQANET